MKKRVEDGKSLRAKEAMLFLLGGGELITNAGRIAKIVELPSGELRLELHDQYVQGATIHPLDSVNNKALYHIKKFDFRKEMLARPDEWVGKKVIDGTEYYFGFNTVYMRVVGTSNEEAKKRKIDLGNNNHFYLRDVEGMEEI